MLAITLIYCYKLLQVIQQGMKSLPLQKIISHFLR